MSKNKRNKNKKGLIIGLILLTMVLMVIVAPMIIRNKANIYAEESVEKGNIETYYSFSGNVESKNIQNIMAERIIQITDINVSEGDKVEEDDVIFQTVQGDEIKSKISGTITKIYVKDDETVMAGTRLCDIVDLDNLKVTLKIDEYDLTSIEKDKMVEVTIGAVDKEIKGSVSEVSDIATIQNGVAYFTASVDLPKDEEVKVGMTVEARIINESVKSVLIIPIEVLHFDEDYKPYVKIKDDNGNVTKQLVEVGINDGKKVEIIEGLSEGQIILLEDSTGSSENSGLRSIIPPIPGR